MNVAVFCGKFDPIHIGHLIQIKRLRDKYGKVLVDIQDYEGRIMKVEKVIDIIKELIGLDDLIFHRYHTSYTIDLPDYPVKDNYVFLTGNKEVIENLRNQGFNVKPMERFWKYEASFLRNAIKKVSKK